MSDAKHSPCLSERLPEGLPDQYIVTPAVEPLAASGDVRFLRQLQKLCATDAASGAEWVGRAHPPNKQPKQIKPLILLRAPELSAEDYADLAERVCEITHAADYDLMLHDRPRLAASLRVAGTHFSQRGLAKMEHAKISRDAGMSDLCFAVSCHTRDEVRHAELAGADFCVLGSVFKTSSHPNASPMGMQRFATIVKASRVPIYAIGGMMPDDMIACRQCGAQGIAGINCFWPHHYGGDICGMSAMAKSHMEKGKFGTSRR